MASMRSINFLTGLIMVLAMLAPQVSSEEDLVGVPETGLLCISECVTCPTICAPPPPPHVVSFSSPPAPSPPIHHQPPPQSYSTYSPPPPPPPSSNKKPPLVLATPTPGTYPYYYIYASKASSGLPLHVSLLIVLILLHALCFF